VTLRAVRIERVGGGQRVGVVFVVEPNQALQRTPPRRLFFRVQLPVAGPLSWVVRPRGMVTTVVAWWMWSAA
jgi:hypothetical protein